MASTSEQQASARVCATVRLPRDLREGVAREAYLRDRSLNQQVTAILRDWLLTHGGKH